MRELPKNLKGQQFQAVKLKQKFIKHLRIKVNYFDVPKPYLNNVYNLRTVIENNNITF